MSGKQLKQISGPNTPPDIKAILSRLETVLKEKGKNAKPIGTSKGVYIFYDYDGEPIYVGQTKESLRARVRRHLSNQRTDAVAMGVLDPLEVAEVELWPFYFEIGIDAKHIAQRLSEAEFTVYDRVIKRSKLHKVLNEKDIPKQTIIELPQSIRARIVPDEVYERLKHADVRIARRASVIAHLTRVIGQREVSPGLRRTLLTQVQRLELLARDRLAEVEGSFPQEQPGEETGETVS